MEKHKKILFIVNPNAGKKRAIQYSEIIMEFENHGYETLLWLTRARGDATEMIISHADDDIDIIACMGGDGTLNETFAGARAINWKKPIGYIPAGSTNDFANSLNIPTDQLKAAHLIVTGEAKSVDLGLFNGRLFVYTACCGLFSNTSYETPQAIKNILGHTAYLVEGVKDFTQFKPVYLKIKYDDVEVEDNFIFVGICNTFSLGGVMKLDENQVSMQDGAFELVAISNPRNAIQLSQVARALIEKKYDTTGLLHFAKVTKCEIVYPHPADWSLDGEREVGKEKNIFEIIPDAVNLIF